MYREARWRPCTQKMRKCVLSYGLDLQYCALENCRCKCVLFWIYCPFFERIHAVPKSIRFGPDLPFSHKPWSVSRSGPRTPRLVSVTAGKFSSVRQQARASVISMLAGKRNIISCTLLKMAWSCRGHFEIHFLIFFFKQTWYPLSKL